MIKKHFIFELVLGFFFHRSLKKAFCHQKPVRVDMCKYAGRQFEGTCIIY